MQLTSGSNSWNEEFWSKRYIENQTQWDIGYVSTPLKTYFDQLEDRELRILIPGGGNGYEAEYLFLNGFENVFLLDISEEPLRRFSRRNPGFPTAQLIHEDFFQHDGKYDLVIEQTFFCALDPALRPAYAEKMHEILKEKAKLVGVLFEDELFEDHPPFGGFRDEYITYFEKYFNLKVFETCYNSIPPRQNRELFINLVKKRS
jgi:thiopurine S-methyltransferase